MRRSRMLVGLPLSCAWATAGATSAQAQGRGFGPPTLASSKLYEYSCHEGNGAVGNALSGERAYEKAVADAIAKGLPIPTRAPTGMEVYTGAPVEGREAVREFGTGK